MKLFSGRITLMSQALIRKLTEEGDLEVSNHSEAQLDIEAILREQIRREKDVVDRAKDLMQKRNLSYEQFAKVKRSLVEEMKIPTGEEIVNYLANQLLECFMRSPNIEEVYTEDVVLRKKIQQILKKYMQVDDELEEEVRGRIKHLSEGTVAYEVEYQKVMEQIKKNRRLVE